VTADATQVQSHPSRTERLAITLPQVWATLAVVIPVAFTVSTLSTPDLAYLIRAGDVMLRTHHLLRTDTFTFTALGRPWLNQQWASELAFAAVFRAGRWEGLAFLQGVLAAAVVAFVYLACRVHGIRSRGAAWLTLAFFPVFSGALILRPQLLGMVLLSVTLWIVARRRNHPRGLWWIPPITAVWANVHGSFALAPLLLLLAWIQDRHDGMPTSNRTLTAAAASAAATLVNPFGVQVWKYAFGITTNARIASTIQEWQPTSVRQITGFFFFASVFGVVVALLWRKDRPPWPKLLGLAVFFGVGLLAVRGARVWGLTAPVFVASIFSDIRPKRPELVHRSYVNTALAAAAIVALVTAFPWSLRSSRLPVGSHLAFAPAGITQTLERTVRPGDRVFDSEHFGSWLEFAFPDARYFVDSRIEIFPDSVWRDYDTVSEAQQGWQATLDRWNVRMVVADRETQPDLIRFARRDPRWRMIYGDRDGAVFVRV